MTNSRTRKLFTRRRQGGYTLAELMVSLSVLGILSSVAIPGMRDVMQNNRRVATTNDFVYTMQVARSEAIARNQRVTVCASRNGFTCAGEDFWSEGWIMFNDIDLNRLPGGTDETILSAYSASGNITIVPNSFSGSYSYRPNGRVMGDAVATQSGEFTFCDSRGATHARVVIAGTSGRPRLSEKRANGSAPSCG